MSTTPDAGSLIWNMLCMVGTLVTLFLFTCEVILNRRLAKAKRDTERRRAAVTSFDDTWTPQGEGDVL